MSYPRDSIDPNRYQALPNEDPATPFRNLDTGPMTSPVTTIDPRPDAWDDVVDSGPFTIDEVVERQRERFGGVKIGSAFFGWLIAVGVVHLHHRVDGARVHPPELLLVQLRAQRLQLVGRRLPQGGEQPQLQGVQQRLDREVPFAADAPENFLAQGGVRHQIGVA